MIKLMKLELKRNNIKIYLLISGISFLVVLGLTYLFAYVPNFNPDDSDLLIFSGYDNILSISILCVMGVYSVLSSVMLSKIVIEEYSGKRSTLLFSYPVNRKKVIIAKILVVFIYNLLLMIISGFLILGIFLLTEQISPMVDDQIMINTVLVSIKNIVIMGLMASSVGIISMGLGFIKKSIPTTIVSSVIIVAILGNIMGGALQNMAYSFVLTVISVILAIVTMVMLSNKVNRMEVV